MIQGWATEPRWVKRVGRVIGKISTIEETPRGRQYCGEAGNVTLCIGPASITFKRRWYQEGPPVEYRPAPADMTALYAAASQPSFRINVWTAPDNVPLAELYLEEWTRRFELDLDTPRFSRWSDEG